MKIWTGHITDIGKVMHVDKMTCHLIHRVFILDRDRVEVRMTGLKTNYRTGGIGAGKFIKLFIHPFDVKRTGKGNDRFEVRVIRNMKDVFLADLSKKVSSIGRSI